MACTRTYRSLSHILVGSPCPDCGHSPLAHGNEGEGIGCAVCEIKDVLAEANATSETRFLRRQVDAVTALIEETRSLGREAIPVDLLKTRMEQA